ncbi:glyoxylate/hydroxypyruvate reductase A [Pseudaminobacter salicylatoxidans]|uniref:Glyoxylate/hydroxypyruvate reductase A n=1 Tax=Pseudaminobacter salicylatoxidans TaxID=93369 RepID=A0A316C454_PSESE|nr:glyoxylate/hydroxypyruvate reductase A [Pseudaminobacter salicylatoxidans]PWJ84525.1 glyoxylate/hydroxypyruvate reductase A [Pseudaminobacter salicylatoxidans]
MQNADTTSQSLAHIHAEPPQRDYGAVLFYSEFDDPRAWGDALKANLPGLDFRVYPDVGDPDDIRHVLAWKAYPGFFAPFRNLVQVVNLGAGVDALVGRTDLPDVPISRLSDPGMMALMKSYVLFSVIRYARDIPAFEQAQRRREWHYIHPRPLHQIKVGVLGLGHLGTAAASGLAAAGFDVRGWDHAPRTIADVRCYGADERGAFLREVEILVNMMPLTPATTGLIDAELLGSLPRGAKFVNASRGAVVDEPALVEALRSGQIGGATLDVFCVEPLPDEHPFWQMDNVLITPHLASITVPEAAARDVAESIRRVSAGGEPLHRIDPQRGY